LVSPIIGKVMARNITRKNPSTEQTDAEIVNLNGMKTDEARLFLEVIRGSIACINADMPIGRIAAKEHLFRSTVRSSLALASLFVQEYRDMRGEVEKIAE